MDHPLRLLFICSQNRMRSPTAEHMLQGLPRYVAKSAGVDRNSKVPVNKELLAWADVIFVMETWHRLFLEEEFPKSLPGKRLICLHIPDEFQYMNPELVRLLRKALARHILLPEPG